MTWHETQKPVVLEVCADADHLAKLDDLVDGISADLPATYVLHWLAHPSIRAPLVDACPPDCLPVLARHMFTRLGTLIVARTYELKASLVIIDELNKPPKMRISYGVWDDAFETLRGQVDIVYVKSAILAGARHG